MAIFSKITEKIRSKLSSTDLNRKFSMLVWSIVVTFMMFWISGLISMIDIKIEYERNYPSQALYEILANRFEHHDIQTFKKSMQIWQEYVKSRQIADQVGGKMYEFKYLYQKRIFPTPYKKLEEQLEKRRQLIKSISLIVDIYYNHFDEIGSEVYEESLHNLFSELLRINARISDVNKEISDYVFGLNLAVFITLVVVWALIFWFFATMITSDIKNTYETLEEMVDKKTKQLQNLNKNLQETIIQEVEISHKKDLVLYQQSRLASMGEMIHNIAHQWRQPLNSLSILIQSFKTKYENGKLTKEFLEEQTQYGVKIAKSMSDTIENFMNFFQPNQTNEYFKMKKAFLSSASLIQGVLERHNIQFCVTAEREYRVIGSENSFTQIAFVMLSNSMDAFLERERPFDNRKIQIIMILEQWQEDSQMLKNRNDSDTQNILTDTKLHILIADNGGGVWLEDLSKIFEPYYTTKHKSVGTGIGLYMVRQIIEKQFNGSISVHNVKFSEVQQLAQSIQSACRCGHSSCTTKDFCECQNNKKCVIECQASPQCIKEAKLPDQDELIQNLLRVRDIESFQRRVTLKHILKDNSDVGTMFHIIIPKPTREQIENMTTSTQNNATQQKEQK